jgi:hypothetical protein
LAPFRYWVGIDDPNALSTGEVEAEIPAGEFLNSSNGKTCFVYLLAVQYVNPDLSSPDLAD